MSTSIKSVERGSEPTGMQVWSAWPARSFFSLQKRKLDIELKGTCSWTESIDAVRVSEIAFVFFGAHVCASLMLTRIRRIDVCLSVVAAHLNFTE